MMRRSLTRQRGTTLLVVLVLLSIMIVGGLSLARTSAAGIFIAGNATNKQGSVQASEVGVNSAFAAIAALPDDSKAVAGWYFPVAQLQGSDGMPEGVDWNSAPLVNVTPYEARYVVERLCAVAVVSDLDHDCLIKGAVMQGSARHGSQQIASPVAKQYRITVRVFMPGTGTTTFVQALMQRS